MSKETLIDQAQKAIEGQYPIFCQNAKLDLHKCSEERLKELIKNPELFLKKKGE